MGHTDPVVQSYYKDLKDRLAVVIQREVPEELETLLWIEAVNAANMSYNGMPSDGGAWERVLSGFAQWAMKQIPPKPDRLLMWSYPVLAEKVQSYPDPFNRITRVTLANDTRTGEKKYFVWDHDTLIAQVEETTAKALSEGMRFQLEVPKSEFYPKGSLAELWSKED